MNEPVRMRTKKLIDLFQKLRLIENKRYSVYGINIVNGLQVASFRFQAV